MEFLHHGPPSAHTYLLVHGVPLDLAAAFGASADNDAECRWGLSVPAAALLSFRSSLGARTYQPNQGEF